MTIVYKGDLETKESGITLTGLKMKFYCFKFKKPTF